MSMIKHNRWIALLIGVLLVCFSAIFLFLQQEEIQETQVENSLPKLGSANVKLNEAHINTMNSLASFHLQNVNNLKERNSFSFDALEKEIQLSAATSEELPSAAVPLRITEDSEPKAEVVVEQVKPDPSLNPPTQLYFTRTELLPQDEKDQATWDYALDDEDLLLLQRIVMAEAEGEPYEGKIAVANVVLNRLRSANFPDTIYKVLYQKYQFSPVANGRFDRVKPNEDSIRAVNEALNGRKEVSDDTYYFLSLQLADDLTVHHTRTFSKTIGNHSFYK